jgi:hypothetical protein
MSAEKDNLYSVRVSLGIRNREEAPTKSLALELRLNIVLMDVNLAHLYTLPLVNRPR